MRCEDDNMFCFFEIKARRHQSSLASGTFFSDCRPQGPRCNRASRKRKIKGQTWRIEMLIALSGVISLGGLDLRTHSSKRVLAEHAENPAIDIILFIKTNQRCWVNVRNYRSPINQANYHGIDNCFEFEFEHICGMYEYLQFKVGMINIYLHNIEDVVRPALLVEIKGNFCKSRHIRFLNSRL